MTCPRCRAENPRDAAFCDECGARLEAACGSCGEANRLGAKFCRNCGQPLAGTDGAVTKLAAASVRTPAHSPGSTGPRRYSARIVIDRIRPACYGVATIVTMREERMRSVGVRELKTHTSRVLQVTTTTCQAEPRREP